MRATWLLSIGVGIGLIAGLDLLAFAVLLGIASY